MELTSSFNRVVPDDLLERYEFAEVRNAAGTLAGTDPAAFEDIVDVLRGFRLTVANLTDPGGNKSEIARDLDLAFRQRGWREAGHESETIMRFRVEPYRDAGERRPAVTEYRYNSSGHKVDNVRARAALDVEWSAKDGNLDRDLSNFRALHDVGVIDVGVIITRHHERTKWAANTLAELSGRIRTNPKGERIVLLATTTTTNFEKLVPRLQRGDGGGCPVLAIAITDRCYEPVAGEPALPPFRGAIEIEGVPAPAEDDSP